jgi:hypothetical protein
MPRNREAFFVLYNNFNPVLDLSIQAGRGEGLK